MKTPKGIFSELQPISRVTNLNYEPEAIRANACFWPRLVYLATYVEENRIIPPVEGVVILNPGDRTVADRLAVIGKIKDGELKVDDIADKPISFEEAPTAYSRLRDNPGKYSSLIFSWKE